MNTNSKKKLRVIIAVTSILTLLFIAIVGREYLNEKRRDEALRYYDEISTTAILADMLGMDMECSDNKGNTWVIKRNNKSLLDMVNQDITDYISGNNQSLYNYKIIENENIQKIY